MTDTMPILLDFESQSRADLKSIGGRAYWAHPSSTPLCVAWYDTRAGTVGVWQTGDVWPHNGRTLAAHNWCGFDRFAAIRAGFCAESHAGVDTSELARRAGFPGALEALGERYGLPKDKAASTFTRGLSTARRPSGKNNPNAVDAATWATYTTEEKRARGVLHAVTPEVMARVIPYCLRDVEIMVTAWADLSEWVDVDADASRVDRIVNDRGVYFGSSLARALLAADERNATEALQTYAAELGECPGALALTANSPAQFVAATGCGNAKAETIDEIIACAAPGSDRYAHNPRPYWFAMARRALASIARGKLVAGLTRASDDSRLRDTHRYYGGHTGRWSGKGMQLQNMPRPAPRFEKVWKDLKLDEHGVGAWIDALADRVTTGLYIPQQDEIDLLLRATICAAPGKTLAVCDFSGVEARALAWASGDLKALEVIASGKDAYKIEAANIYGCSYDDVDKTMRGIGKVAVLACGYGMGHAKMYANNAAALDAAGIDAKEVVDAWRKLHAPCVRLWRDCEDALVLAIGGHPSKVSCFDFCPSDNGRDVAVYLPSGRPIVYREARCSDTVTSWGQTKSSPSFLATKGMREHTYGGKIVENLIQAMCRDLMADALVRTECAGLSPVMHVHDEIVCEVDGAQGAVALEYLHEITTTLPSWATGFPVGAAGFHARRYRK